MPKTKRSRHKLLVYDQISRRMRGKLLLLELVLFGVGSYDLFVRPIFGDYWFFVWIIVGLLLLLSFYYAVLMRRAAIIVRPEHLLLRGPLRQVKISYGRIATVVSTKPSQHIQLDQLPQRERALLAPIMHVTCVFIELHSFPKKLEKGHLWFPRSLFSTLLPGLLLIVPDWMALSRQAEQARAAYRDKQHEKRREDKRTLASRVLDY